jgi:glutathione-independent formaldehyde dehydrogenase
MRVVITLPMLVASSASRAYSVGVREIRRPAIVTRRFSVSISRLPQTILLARSIPARRGAAVVIVGDMNPDRLAQARSFGCETVDLRTDAELPDMIAQIVGEPVVDAAVDCVGFEARGHGAGAGEAPATVLNDVMSITRVAGRLGISGLYVTGDPGGIDENARIGQLGVRIGLGWAKSLSFTTGQCPVMRYNRQLMMAILNDKVQIAKAVNATVISLEEAPQGYRDFDKGAARKFVLNPNDMIPSA